MHSQIHSLREQLKRKDDRHNERVSKLLSSIEDLQKINRDTQLKQQEAFQKYQKKIKVMVNKEIGVRLEEQRQLLEQQHCMDLLLIKK